MFDSLEWSWKADGWKELGGKGDSKGEVGSLFMIMNLNLQLTGVEMRWQLQKETETWARGGTQVSMWVCLAVTHSTGDMEPGRIPLLARQEPQWSNSDINQPTQLST